ncbi:MAG: malto-oligosyltrehalose trehalohydrolase [Burkholderiaceae bacterium]
MTLRHRRQLPFGAEIVSPTRTRFRLWAPSCKQVAVVIDDEDIAMFTSDEGWFEIDLDRGPGTRYRFRVSPTGGEPVIVPDPASRAQDGDVHDPSIVVDPEAFRWTHDAWLGRPWCETIIYEVHVGLAGGFAGVLALLPRLAALGVTAIELMPIADFAGPRNWGYDGVLPFAPEASYGTPDELKKLIDAAHGHGLMVFLDVVYNHFGPDGNYIGVYADAFFRDDIKTPWGRAIDFRKREVRDYFSENALYWLQEYRFDGLRLDATHSIVPQDWLEELSAIVKDAIDNARHVHLVVEHDGNAAHLLGPDRGNLGGYDAQWNDDAHHVLHVLLTGESDGYYIDFADQPADKLARCLSEGFVYQGQPSIFRKGLRRGEPSKDLPPTAFVMFLQNHDQVGNRAFGERIHALAEPAALEAAYAMLLLTPQIPLLFMGEECNSPEPFLFFTSYPDEELAEAVREGRRGEFASARGFDDEASRHRIPDPNHPDTYVRSRPAWSLALNDPPETPDNPALARTRLLIALRREHIVPRLEGARSLGAEAVGPSAVIARWHMGDGSVLTIAVNLGATEVSIPAHRFHMRGRLIHAVPALDPTDPADCLPGYATWAVIEDANDRTPR